VSKLLEKLADLQTHRPFVILLLAAVISAGSLPFIRNLGLDSRFIALLPESSPSVEDLDKVRDRVRGLSALTIAVQSPSKDVDAMRRFVGDLVTQLEELPPDEIGVVDWNVGAYDDFVREHKHLYASLDLLERLRDALEDRHDRERLKHNPLWVDLLEDDERESLDDILDELETESDRGEERSEKFPDGYYQHEDGDLIAMFIRSEVGSDPNTAGRIIDRVQAEIDRLNPTSYAPDLKLTLSGDVIMAEEEQQAIARELLLATTLTVTIVMLLVVLFFGRPRAIVLLGAGLVPPQYSVGRLCGVDCESVLRIIWYPHGRGHLPPDRCRAFRWPPRQPRIAPDPPRRAHAPQRQASSSKASGRVPGLEVRATCLQASGGSGPHA